VHWSGYDASKKMKIDQTLRSGLFEFDLYQMSHGASPARTNSTRRRGERRCSCCRWARDWETRGAWAEGESHSGRVSAAAWLRCARTRPLAHEAPNPTHARTHKTATSFIRGARHAHGKAPGAACRAEPVLAVGDMLLHDVLDFHLHHRNALHRCAPEP
jgi:hypothetical protein